jgi:hypothetical protein
MYLPALSRGSVCVLGGEMRQKRVLVILRWLSVSAFLLGHMLAQTPPAGQAQDATKASPCIPSAPSTARPGGVQEPGMVGQGQQGRGRAAQQAPRDLTTTAIPGVVSAGVRWTKVWQEAGNSADGIISDKDGSVLVHRKTTTPSSKSRPTAKRLWPWRVPKVSAHYRWIGRAAFTACTEPRGPDRRSPTKTRS